MDITMGYIRKIFITDKIEDDSRIFLRSQRSNNTTSNVYKTSHSGKSSSAKIYNIKSWKYYRFRI